MRKKFGSFTESAYLCTRNADIMYAQMAELVDALVSNTNAARRAGSIPALGTTKICKQYSACRFFCSGS